jgi:hypothetical protein
MTTRNSAIAIDTLEQVFVKSHNDLSVCTFPSSPKPSFPFFRRNDRLPPSLLVFLFSLVLSFFFSLVFWYV